MSGSQTKHELLGQRPDLPPFRRHLQGRQFPQGSVPVPAHQRQQPVDAPHQSSLLRPDPSSLLERPHHPHKVVKLKGQLIRQLPDPRSTQVFPLIISPHGESGHRPNQPQECPPPPPSLVVQFHSHPRPQSRSPEPAHHDQAAARPASPI